jgi:hypothetical protein
MDLGPNPGENEEPGARLGRIPPSGCKKRPPETKSRGQAGDALMNPWTQIRQTAHAYGVSDPGIAMAPFSGGSRWH